VNLTAVHNDSFPILLFYNGVVYLRVLVMNKNGFGIDEFTDVTKIELTSGGTTFDITHSNEQHAVFSTSLYMIAQVWTN